MCHKDNSLNEEKNYLFCKTIPNSNLFFLVVLIKHISIIDITHYPPKNKTRSESISYYLQKLYMIELISLNNSN